MESKADIYLAIEAALAAGEVIRTIYERPVAEYEIEKKEDASPLTLADREANSVITGFLRKTSYPILSEEESIVSYETRKQWESLWIVDPLDGTKEFIKRNGEFTVNIAWVKNNKPIIGVIYVPVTAKLYFSGLSIGAFCVENIQNLTSYPDLDSLMQKGTKLPEVSESENYRVVASRSHTSPELNEYLEKLKKQHNKPLETVSIGSSLKFCLVAEGSADCYPRLTPTMEWDTAAGHAIALAAGMSVSLINSDKPLVYNREDLLNPYFIVENKNAK